MWLLINLKLLPIKLQFLILLQLLPRALQLTRVLPDGLSLPSSNDNVSSVDGLSDESHFISSNVNGNNVDNYT